MKDHVFKLLSALLVACLLLSPAALMEESVTEVMDAVVEETSAELVPDGAPAIVGEAPVAVESVPQFESAEASPTVLSVTKKATVKVYLGTTYKIEVPNKTVKSFKSGDKKVASVSSDGVVTLKKAGKVKITVKLSKKKKFVVTLKIIDPTVPTKVTISEGTTGVLSVGTPFQLTATVEPVTANPTVKWKSSEKSVATVDANGLVTPLKKGTAKITATAGKKKAIFTAEVRNNGIVELSPYWSKSLSKTLKEFDGFKNLKWSGGYVAYSDGNVRLVEYREGKYKSGIGNIHVEGTDRYTLFGVSVGMSREDAKALLKDYEGKGDYSEYGDYIIYSMHYPDVDDWFTVMFKDGKVISMELNCFTNM